MTISSSSSSTATSSLLPLHSFPPFSLLPDSSPPVISPSYTPPSSSSSSSSSCLSDHTLRLAIADSPPLPPPTFNRDYFNSLPPGYRFSPTDEELVMHYLAPLLTSRPLPPNRILTVDIYGHHPAILAEVYKECGENELYFFTSRTKKYPRGSRPKRSTGTGYWKATGSGVPVMSVRRGTMIATRRSLVFYLGKPTKATKTDWLMHEFTLKTSSTNTKFDAYVLCKIYRKKPKCSTKEEEEGGSSTLTDQNNNEETNQVMEIDQTGPAVANTVHGPAHVEQHQHQQPQSHGPAHVEQHPQQYQQQPSSHHSLPQSHQLVDSNNTLKSEYNGMTTTNTTYVSAQVEQYQQQQTSSIDQLMGSNNTLNVEQNGMITTNTTIYVSSQVGQYQQQTSSQYSLPLIDDQLMGIINAEQNRMVTTNTSYGSAHFEANMQYHSASNPNEFQQGMDMMKQNGQCQHADLLSSFNDQCSSLPDFDFDPDFLLDLPDDDHPPPKSTITDVK